MIYEDDFNFNMLKTFYAVATTKSFSAASNMLYISQPAVSYTIKKLEEYYGTPLFERGTKSLVLTKVAENLLPIVENILNNINKCKETVQLVKHMKLGKLNIGVQSHIYAMVGEQINKFINKFPNIQLIFKEASTDNLVDMLESSDIDILIDIPPINTNGTAFTIEKITEVDLCIAYNPKFQPSNFVPKLENIVDKNIIVPLAYTTRRKLLDNQINNLGLTYEPKIETSSTNIITNTVRSTNFFGLLFKQNIKKDLEEGNLCAIEICKNNKFEICACYNPSTSSRFIKEFINTMKE